MKKAGGGVMAIIAIVVILAIGAFSSYNGLVGLDEEVNNSYADLQTAVQRRADLINKIILFIL